MGCLLRSDSRENTDRCPVLNDGFSWSAGGSGATQATPGEVPTRRNYKKPFTSLGIERVCQVKRLSLSLTITTTISAMPKMIHFKRSKFGLRLLGA